MKHFHHRTIRHIDSRDLNKPPQDRTDYLTVHEFHFDKTFPNREPIYTGYSVGPSSPMSREEAEWIAQAFNMPPAVEVDEASMFRDPHTGVADYHVWKWLVPHDDTSEEIE